MIETNREKAYNAYTKAVEKLSRELKLFINMKNEGNDWFLKFKFEDDPNLLFRSVRNNNKLYNRHQSIKIDDKIIYINNDLIFVF